MLFHEIYSSYYIAVSSILKEAVRGTLTGKKLNALVQEHAFGESLLTIPDGLKGEKWRLIHKDLSTPLEEEPSMPRTILEKRWMKALLLDPRIRLFMPDMAGLEGIGLKEIGLKEIGLGGIGLEDVEPLFELDFNRILSLNVARGERVEIDLFAVQIDRLNRRCAESFGIQL